MSFWPELWKPKQNFAELLKYIHQAAGMGAQVIASPEGALDGYITRDLKKHRIRPADHGSKGYARRLERFRARQLRLAEEIKVRYVPALCAEAARPARPSPSRRPPRRPQRPADGIFPALLAWSGGLMVRTVQWPWCCRWYRLLREGSEGGLP